MKYTTYKHPKYDFYVQQDNTGKPVVIYYFGEKYERKVLQNMTVITEPDYFVLPQLDSIEKVCPLETDYAIDCECFADLDSAMLVCTGNHIQLTNLQSPIEVVLAKGQSLHAVKEKHSFNEDHKYLAVAPTQEQRTEKMIYGNFIMNRKFTSTKINYGFNSLPSFNIYSSVKINKQYEFDQEKQEVLPKGLQTTQGSQPVEESIE